MAEVEVDNGVEDEPVGTDNRVMSFVDEGDPDVGVVPEVDSVVNFPEEVFSIPDPDDDPGVVVTVDDANEVPLFSGVDPEIPDNTDISDANEDPGGDSGEDDPEVICRADVYNVVEFEVELVPEFAFPELVTSETDDEGPELAEPEVPGDEDSLLIISDINGPS